MITSPLAVLMVEDNPADAELLVRELRRAGFELRWQRVDTEAAFIHQLDTAFDVVLSDYQMPHFDGRRALQLFKERGLEIPFIIVSGTIGEEVAVEAIKQGATDYLLKDRLVRLGQVVTHAIAECRLRRERRQSDEALRLFRTLIDQSSDMLEIIDPETARILDVNGRGPAELGCTRTEYLSLSVFALDPTRTLAGWQKFVAALRETGSQCGEGAHRRKDGTTFPIEFSARWVRLDRDYIVTVVRDISKRKQAESELRASEERFRQLAENIHEVFWITDPERRHVFYVSPAYEKIWGRTCESLYLEPHRWPEAIHPDDRERVSKSALSTQVAGTYDEEYRITQPDGSERWIRDRAFPVRAPGGRVERMVGVAEDITESKKLREQFLRAQRMEAIGLLAGGIAHDLNNVLAPILIGVPILRANLTDENALQMLHLIETSVKRGSSIIRRVLGFARGVGEQRIPIDLRILLKEIAEIASETFPKSIRVETDVPEEIWPVRGDVTQLHQVLLNLAVNARDAMPNGGRLTIKALNFSLDENHHAPDPEGKPRPYVILQIADTGMGIPQAIRDRIFDPFFTTKEVGKGTGLGLASTLAIVKGHDGFIQFDSEMGKGTVFKIYLPAQPTEAYPSVPELPQVLRGQGELVLVIEDEDAIRQVMRKTLERFGYRVLLASNGAEGIATFAQNQTAIAVVITDMLMPVLDGTATITALRELQPGVRIIATSGVAPNIDMRYFLAKPYTAEALLTALGKILHLNEQSALK